MSQILHNPPRLPESPPPIPRLSRPVLAMPADNIELVQATFTLSDWRALNRKNDPHWCIHNGRDVLAIVWADDLHDEQETAEKFKRAYRALGPLVEALQEAAKAVSDPEVLARINEALAIAEVEPEGGETPAH